MTWASHLQDDESLREKYVDRDLSHWTDPGVPEHTRKDQIMNLITVGAVCGIVALVLILIVLL